MLARCLLYAIVILCLLPVFFPGSPITRQYVQEDYVKRMIAMEGVPYFWGGENKYGIDCSGLPRRALRDALLADGLSRLNGTAVRMWAEQWWFDASARALAASYRNYTVDLQQSGTIKTMSYEGLEPGDLAVTKNGVHILSYIGKDLWIQASPGAQKVIILNGRTDESPWFTVPVTTHRWSALSPQTT